MRADRWLIAALAAVFVGLAVDTAVTLRAKADPVRFEPGRYLIEPTGDEDGWIVQYASPWHVTRIPARPKD